MKKTIYTLLLLITAQFAKSEINLSINASIESRVIDLVQDKYGFIYAGYNFKGVATIFGNKTISSKNNTSDFVIAKYNPLGKIIWYHHFSGEGNDEIKALNLDVNNNIYFIGNFEKKLEIPTDKDLHNISSKGLSDIVIGKINSNQANILFLVNVGTSNNDYASNFALDWQDGLIFTNYETPEGNKTIFSLKLNRISNVDGNVLFSKDLGISNNNKSEIISALKIDKKNQIFIAANFNESAESNLSATGILKPKYQNDIILKKYDISANTVWTTVLSSSDNIDICSNSLVFDKSNSICLLVNGVKKIEIRSADEQKNISLKANAAITLFKFNNIDGNVVENSEIPTSQAGQITNILRDANYNWWLTLKLNENKNLLIKTDSKGKTLDEYNISASKSIIIGKMCVANFAHEVWISLAYEGQLEIGKFKTGSKTKQAIALKLNDNIEQWKYSKTDTAQDMVMGNFVAEFKKSNTDCLLYIEYLVLQTNTMVDLGIYDFKGKLINQYSKESQKPGVQTMFINVGGYPKGYYFIKYNERTKPLIMY